MLTNDELARRVDTSDEWVRTRTGIRQRHIAACAADVIVRHLHRTTGRHVQQDSRVVAVRIVVNDVAYLVDFGPGVVRRANAAFLDKGVKALDPVKLRVVFVTAVPVDGAVIDYFLGHLPDPDDARCARP